MCRWVWRKWLSWLQFAALIGDAEIVRMLSWKTIYKKLPWAKPSCFSVTRWDWREFLGHHDNGPQAESEFCCSVWVLSVRVNGCHLGSLFTWFTFVWEHLSPVPCLPVLDVLVHRVHSWAVCGLRVFEGPRSCWLRGPEACCACGNPRSFLASAWSLFCHQTYPQATLLPKSEKKKWLVNVF